jgi:hypothetical protein
MKKTLVILTRMYIDQGCIENDEFLAVKCPNNDKYKLIRSLNIDILIIHGFNNRFSSADPFKELSAEVRSYLGSQKGYLFYHSGNEDEIEELSDIPSSNDNCPFYDSIAYSLEGGGDELIRGNTIDALYKAIAADNEQKANECAEELLRSFQHDSTTPHMFTLVNALCNLPFDKNPEEVTRMIALNNKLAGLKIESILLSDYIIDNYLNIEIMRRTAIFVKEQLQTN